VLGRPGCKSGRGWVGRRAGRPGGLAVVGRLGGSRRRVGHVKGLNVVAARPLSGLSGRNIRRAMGILGYPCSKSGGYELAHGSEGTILPPTLNLEP